MPLDLGLGDVGDDVVVEGLGVFEVATTAMIALLGADVVLDENGVGRRLGPEDAGMLAVLRAAAVVGGIWQQLDMREIGIVFAAVAAMLALAFTGAWLLGGLLRLARPDRITMLFAGAQKSIAVGAPLAATLFPPAVAGMVLVPILIYHMAQLIVSAWIAPGLARRGDGIA